MIKAEAQIKIEKMASRRINSAFMAAVRDLFANEILPAAVSGSPYDPTSGSEVHNKDSLSVTVRRRGNTVIGSIFTQSGHGGFLEKGTAKMSPQPYIYPAWSRGAPKIHALIEQRINEMGELDVMVEDLTIEGLSAAVNKRWAPPKRHRKAKS